MFYRKTIEALTRWKDTKEKSLLVYGARQVGKTTLIRDFCERSFPSFAEINFASNARALELLLETRDLDDFLLKLSLLVPNDFLHGGVLFLDEIQEYYRARRKRIDIKPDFATKYVDVLTLAKPIAEQGAFRLILSGSMLGVSLFDVNLNPTGYVQNLTMYPMDFEEYLLAMGVDQGLITRLSNAFHQNEEVDPSLNENMLSLFREYMLVGGMPEAVKTYKEKKSFSALRLVHESILDWYRKDIVKYAPLDSRLIIAEMFELLPSEIAAKNRKFVKSHLDVKNFKNLDLKDRYLWLSSAGIAIPIHNVTNPAFPLRLSQDSKLVKLFASDVGLLSSCLFDDEAKALLLQNEAKADFGAVYENVVAEELLTHGHRPYYHSLKKEGEVDFILEKGLDVLPIEVKSGKGGERFTYPHPSLNRLLESHPEIEMAYVFGNTNVFSESPRIKNYPLYMIDFLRR